MKHLSIRTGLLALTLALPLFAADKKRAAVSGTFQAPAQRSKASLIMGAGVADVYGFWGLHFRLGAEFRVSNKPLLIGAESGVMVGLGFTGIPILGTMTYEVQDFSTKTFQTRFGVSLGPIINIGRRYWFWLDRDDGTSVSIAILTRPGGRVKMAENMALDVEVLVGGTLGGDFILSPQASLVINL